MQTRSLTHASILASLRMFIIFQKVSERLMQSVIFTREHYGKYIGKRCRAATREYITILPEKCFNVFFV